MAGVVVTTVSIGGGSVTVITPGIAVTGGAATQRFPTAPPVATQTNQLITAGVANSDANTFAGVAATSVATGTVPSVAPNAGLTQVNGGTSVSGGAVGTGPSGTAAAAGASASGASKGGIGTGGVVAIIVIVIVLIVAALIGFVLYRRRQNNGRKTNAVQAGSGMAMNMQQFPSDPSGGPVSSSTAGRPQFPNTFPNGSTPSFQSNNNDIYKYGGAAGAYSTQSLASSNANFHRPSTPSKNQISKPIPMTVQQGQGQGQEYMGGDVPYGGGGQGGQGGYGGGQGQDQPDTWSQFQRQHEDEGRRRREWQDQVARRV